MSVSSKSVEDLLADVRDGRLVIPSFQRSFIWKPQESAAFLNSLLKGHPVGALLMWSTNQDVAFKTTLGVAPRPGEMRDYLLDGQQRVTSLVVAASPPEVKTGRGPKPRRLMFDVDKGIFLAEAPSRRSEFSVDAHVVLDPTTPWSLTDRLISLGLAHSDERWSRLHDNLHQARMLLHRTIPCETTRVDDLEQVAEIFMNINKSGRRLTGNELVYSCIASRWPRMTAEYDELLKEDGRYSGDLLGGIVLTDVLRLLTIVSGLGSRPMDLVTAPGKTDDEMLEAWSTTISALTSATLLVEDAGFIQGDTLPAGSMCTIAYAMLRHPDTDDRDLIRWLYTAALFGERYGSSVSSAECRIIDEEDDWLDELMNRSLVSAVDVTSDVVMNWTLVRNGDKLSRRAETLLCAMAMRPGEGSVDWLFDSPLGDDAVQRHHIFPQARMRETHPEHFHSLANVAFISARSNNRIKQRPASIYLPEIKQDRLEHQWVPLDRDLWTDEHFTFFLRERSRLIADAVNEALGQ